MTEGPASPTEDAGAEEDLDVAEGRDGPERRDETVGRAVRCAESADEPADVLCPEDVACPEGADCPEAADGPVDPAWAEAATEDSSRAGVAESAGFWREERCSAGAKESDCVGEAGRAAEVGDSCRVGGSACPGDGEVSCVGAAGRVSEARRIEGSEGVRAPPEGERGFWVLDDQDGWGVAVLRLPKGRENRRSGDLDTCGAGDGDAGGIDGREAARVADPDDRGSAARGAPFVAVSFVAVSFEEVPFVEAPAWWALAGGAWRARPPTGGRCGGEGERCTEDSRAARAGGRSVAGAIREAALRALNDEVLCVGRGLAEAADHGRGKRCTRIGSGDCRVGSGGFW
ncbi:hypothetical protein GCM10022223_17300 [Kineosporia mesophila]|uniref:Uncharacterized protein n=1 Tax=Kineosporia mesophila TaxID=566012 RepID=A0ABP6Z8P0_9ACTN